MQLTQFHQLRRYCSAEHFDRGFSLKRECCNGFAHCGSRRVGMVVFCTEMAQPDALSHGCKMRAQSSRSEHICQVSASTRDAILKIFGIRTICQHVGVVIGFDDQIFCALHIGNHIVGELPGVGDETEGGQGCWSILRIFSYVFGKISNVFWKISDVFFDCSEISGEVSES